MKIKSLKMTGVFGYLNLNIRFNRDLTFMVGINGSGKTTALRLIEALLTPSPMLLDKIPHVASELTIDVNRRAVKINSSVSNGLTTISIPSLEGDNTLIYPYPEARDSLPRGVSNEGRDPYAALLPQINSHPVIQYLRDQLDTPLFLGIDRRNVSLHFGIPEDGAPSIGTSKQRAMHLHYIRNRMPISGQLGSSLVDVQLMIQEIYKKTIEEQQKFATQLTESIFLDAFDYQPGSGFFRALRQNSDASKFLTSIIQKKEGVQAALKNSGLPEQKYLPVVSKFFSHVEALEKKASESVKDSISSAVSDVAIELAFNKPVVDRVLKLIDASETYNKSINQIWGPIKDFLSLVNRFFSDGEKELIIDQVGWLNVKICGGEPRSLEALSSGERQIVVIFGHLAINRELNRAGIFIIDEPELSLHLKWQEIFVDSLLSVGPKNQFVLATHSPAIVMEKQINCASIDKSKRG